MSQKQKKTQHTKNKQSFLSKFKNMYWSQYIYSQNDPQTTVIISIVNKTDMDYIIRQARSEARLIQK